MKAQNNKQILNLQVTEGLAVAVIQNPNYEFLMPTKDVALGYGISSGTIRKHQATHSDDLTYGKHFIKGVDLSNTPVKGLQPHAVYWTKAGVIRLGFIIQSKRGKMFRDWAENVILEVTAPSTKLPPVQKRNHNRLTANRLLDIMIDVAKVDNKDVRLSLMQKLGL